MLYMLWDLRLKVGHSSRTVKDCLRLGREDYTIRTAMLEHRPVCGDAQLAGELTEQLWSDLFKGTEPSSSRPSWQSGLNATRNRAANAIWSNPT